MLNDLETQEKKTGSPVVGGSEYIIKMCKYQQNVYFTLNIIIHTSVCVHGIIILYQKGNDHIGTRHIAVKLFGAGSPTDRLWSWD